MTTEDLLEIPVFLDRRRTNTTAKEETMQTTAETITETAKVTKLPPAKAKGVKTQADVKNPKRTRQDDKALSENAKTSLARMAKQKRKPGTAKGRKVKKTKTGGRQTVKSQAKAKAAKTGKAKRFGWAKDDFANDDKITVVKKNPYEKGTKAAERFKLFQSGQTVAECLAAQKAKGWRRRRIAIRTAREHKYIEIKSK